MAGPSIEKIALRQLDASGNDIQWIFAKNTVEHAIHHAATGAVVRSAGAPDRNDHGVSRLLASHLAENRRAPWL